MSSRPSRRLSPSLRLARKQFREYLRVLSVHNDPSKRPNVVRSFIKTTTIGLVCQFPDQCDLLPGVDLALTTEQSLEALEGLAVKLAELRNHLDQYGTAPPVTWASMSFRLH